MFVSWYHKKNLSFWPNYMFPNPFLRRLLLSPYESLKFDYNFRFKRTSRQVRATTPFSVSFIFIKYFFGNWHSMFGLDVKETSRFGKDNTYFDYFDISFKRVFLNVLECYIYIYTLKDFKFKIIFKMCFCCNSYSIARIWIWLWFSLMSTNFCVVVFIPADIIRILSCWCRLAAQSSFSYRSWEPYFGEGEGVLNWLPGVLSWPVAIPSDSVCYVTPFSEREFFDLFSKSSSSIKCCFDDFRTKRDLISKRKYVSALAP